MFWEENVFAVAFSAFNMGLIFFCVFLVLLAHPTKQESGKDVNFQGGTLEVIMPKDKLKDTTGY